MTENMDRDRNDMIKNIHIYTYAQEQFDHEQEPAVGTVSEESNDT